MIGLPKILRRLEVILVVFWLVMIVVVSVEMAREPESYSGRHPGLLYVAIGSLMGSVAQLVPSARLRAALSVLMFIPLAAALFAIFG